MLPIYFWLGTHMLYVILTHTYEQMQFDKKNQIWKAQQSQSVIFL